MGQALARCQAAGLEFQKLETGVVGAHLYSARLSAPEQFRSTHLFFSRGAAVDSRMISSAGTLIVSAEFSPDMSRSRFSIASCPILRIGWRTVVSGGCI